MKTYQINCLSEALSPITHMSGTAGNVAVIAREPVTTPRGLCWLPFLSGNALRHRCVREPGVLWLIEEYGLRGELNLDQLNFLLHGGNLTQSNARENTKRIVEMHRTWPLLRLLGASLPDQILAGSMDVWRGTLVCEENRKSLVDPPDGRLYSAERFVGEYQYTRGDAVKRGMESDAPKVFDEKSNLMIFSGQSVQRGSLWQHGFVLKHVSELELGALLWSLRLWQEAGGTIGGQAARGHGRLRCEILGHTQRRVAQSPHGQPETGERAAEFDQQKLCDDYVAYARDVKDDAVAWLKEAWGK